MPILHNQINKLWYNPTYEKFKRSSFVKQVFTQKDSEDFIATGAYLVKMARKFSKKHIPWDQDRRLEILANPRLENALFSLGAEYLIKGVFLNKGFAVNKPLRGVNFTNYPIRISRNKARLDKSDVQTLRYFRNNIGKVIDFTNFDNKQKKEEKKEKDKVKELEFINLALKDIEKRAVRQKAAYDNGVTTLGEYKDDLARNDAEKDELTLRLETKRIELTQETKIENQSQKSLLALANFKSLWKTAELSQKKELLHSILEKVIIKDSQIETVFAHN